MDIFIYFYYTNVCEVFLSENILVHLDMIKLCKDCIYKSFPDNSDACQVAGPESIPRLSDDIT
jgi:hypothetical protein